MVFFRLRPHKHGHGIGCGWKKRPPVLRVSDTDTWHGRMTDARLQGQTLQNLLILPYRIARRRMDERDSPVSWFATYASNWLARSC